MFCPIFFYTLQATSHTLFLTSHAAKPTLT